MCGWIVGNTFDRTVVRIVIRRFTEAIECGDIWCGCDYEHIWCNDELLRFICGTVAERVFLSQSCHCRFIIVFTWTGIDLTCQKYAAHFGHIQCHQWWVHPQIEFFVLFSAAVSFHAQFYVRFRWLLFENFISGASNEKQNEIFIIIWWFYSNLDERNRTHVTHTFTSTGN